jgi:L-threonylcarbamoyladenylate synthase
VGLRVPSHPVALELLRAAGVPVAAPSANRSEEVSPTTAQHVADSLGPFVDDLLILDGGPTTVGLESTVLDVTADPPRILRPGMVTAPMLRELIGEVTEGGATEGIARSPGQMLRHYAPKVPVLVVPTEEIRTMLERGDGLLVIDPTLWQYVTYGLPPLGTSHTVRATLPMPPDAHSYAAQLYKALRTADDMGVTRIIIEAPPHGPEWEAIHDRLRRAATPKSEDGKS